MRGTLVANDEAASDGAVINDNKPCGVVGTECNPTSRSPWWTISARTPFVGDEIECESIGSGVLVIERRERESDPHDGG